MAPYKHVTEIELLREVLFSFQGINNGSTILVMDKQNDNKFKINDCYIIDGPTKDLALRLSNIGWLFSKINSYLNHLTKDPSSCGHVSQSFASALSNELQSHHELIVKIEDQIQLMTAGIEMGSPDGNNPADQLAVVSLHRLQVWTFDHFYRLKMLYRLIESCKHKRGGQLVNAVYVMMRTGDPSLKSCLNRILNQMVVPLKRMLSQWIFHGEIDDPFKEFFITIHHITVAEGASGYPGADNSVGADSLWHEKYSINSSMLPGFIPMDQAKMILATGKAVNLLLQGSTSGLLLTGSGHSDGSGGSNRQLMCPEMIVSGYEDLKTEFEKTDIEVLFSSSPCGVLASKKPSTGAWLASSDDGLNSLSSTESNSLRSRLNFRQLLQKAHTEISLKAKKVLFDDHRLMSHLYGLRQFLLLGQGDFIRHLMDLLVPELDKPVHRIKTHSLNSLLNTAIQSTNAQFLDEDVIQRIDCCLTEPKSMETEVGWDIFTLSYMTKGPIGTILTPECMATYSKLFKHLWRSKRMEYVLSSLWRVHMSNYRNINTIPGLRQIYHQNYMLIQEMTHFVQQMQYYIEFEVIECSWHEFISRINNSQDVDQLVDAHQWFLLQVFNRSMLDPASEGLNSQLRSIYEGVVEFHKKLNHLDVHVTKEVMIRKKMADKKAGDPIDPHELQERRQFESDYLPDFNFKYQTASRTYQTMVQQFLILLADHPDEDMKFLSIRLDFNEHYKKKNKFLETSFTYSHRLSLDTSIRQ